MRANQKQDRYETKFLNSINQPIFKVHARNFSMAFVECMRVAPKLYPDRDPNEVRSQIKKLCIQFIDEWEEGADD